MVTLRRPGTTSGQMDSPDRTKLLASRQGWSGFRASLVGSGASGRSAVLGVVADDFTDSEIALARAAAHRLPGAWSLATERDYEGHLSLILMPEGDDAAGPTFLLDRDAACVGVAACRWERIARLGRFPSVEVALARIAEVVG